MTEVAYCTYFDHRYAALGLTMLRSLRQQGGTGTLWVLCLSETAEGLISGMGLSDVRVIGLDAIEAHFPALALAKADRSTIEYYFTLTPHLVQYVFDHSDAHKVAYLDSDLYFFSPVREVWIEAGGGPVAIIPHNFHPRAAHLQKYGIYNVGWVSFSRSEQGLRCLDFWASSCRAWCRDVPDGDRFADQGYLSRFHEMAPNLKVIEHKGCNVGPWNIARYAVHSHGGRPWVDDVPLIFFHFAGFRRGLGGRWFTSHRMHRTGTPRIVRECLYRPYLTALIEARVLVDKQLSELPPSSAANALVRNNGSGVPIKARLYQPIRRLFQIYDLVTGQALAEPSQAQAAKG